MRKTRPVLSIFQNWSIRAYSRAVRCMIGRTDNPFQPNNYHGIPSPWYYCFPRGEGSIYPAFAARSAPSPGCRSGWCPRWRGPGCPPGGPNPAPPSTPSPPSHAAKAAASRWYLTTVAGPWPWVLSTAAKAVSSVPVINIVNPPSVRHFF